MSNDLKKRHNMSHKLREFIAGGIVAILSLIMIWGISYGFNNLSELSQKTSLKGQSSNKTTNLIHVTSPNQPHDTSTPVNNSSSALINTGPGESTVIAFIVVVISGTLIHYVWRNNSLNRD